MYNLKQLLTYELHANGVDSVKADIRVVAERIIRKTKDAAHLSSGLKTFNTHVNYCSLQDLVDGGYYIAYIEKGNPERQAMWRQFTKLLYENGYITFDQHTTWYYPGSCCY